jgi:hypothetical protein
MHPYYLQTCVKDYEHKSKRPASLGIEQRVTTSGCNYSLDAAQRHRLRIRMGTTCFYTVFYQWLFSIDF